MNKATGQMFIIVSCLVSALWGLFLSAKGIHWISVNGHIHPDFLKVLFLTALFALGGLLCGFLALYLFKIRCE
jgi:hypothetical protein